MNDGFVEQMERITEHLGDGWLIENFAVEPGGVGATVQYAHRSERRIRWRVGPEGQSVRLRSATGRVHTWLDTDSVCTSRAADAIQDCAWFVERDGAPVDSSPAVADGTPADSVESPTLSATPDPFARAAEPPFSPSDADLTSRGGGPPDDDRRLSTDGGVPSDHHICYPTTNQKF